ncbi:hypothetical protein FOCC_FOCC015400 [Frankliniella occidentalis]|nr:hypothetical protein FOCC_FOCC015400 [Frankliniella occidentalis]
MVKNLSNTSSSKKAPKRAEIKEDSIAGAVLKDFVNSHTREFFDILEIDASFLDVSPAEWPTNAGYIKALDTVSALHVVNDVAERAVRLTSDYNCGLTHKEQNFQDLLLVMHRSRQNETKSSCNISHYVKKEENKSSDE